MTQPGEKLLDISEEADKVGDTELTEAGPDADPAVLITGAGVVLLLLHLLAPLAPPEVFP